MDENPYSAPAASTAVQDATEASSLRTVATRGAKGGMLIGMGIFGAISVYLICVVVMLIFATVAETRGSGGFMNVIDRMTNRMSIIELIGGLLAGLAVFAAWGAIMGTLAKTLSAWFHR